MASTALMPVDPAVSAQQVNRILPIRAQLLPDEIKEGRSARRTRYLLIGIVVVVILALAGWYAYAVRQVSAAEDNLAAATDQIVAAQNSKKPYGELTGIINETKMVDAQLQKLLSADLPWATWLDRLRGTGTQAGLTIKSVNGSVAGEQAPVVPPGGGTSSTPVATLTLTGTAPDKNTIARYVDLLNTTPGVANSYLTSANQTEKGLEFSLSADLTGDVLCGRFNEKKCGGK